MQNKIIRIILLFFSLFLLGNTNAQVGSWRTYMAYYQATIVAETPNYVFGVYDGSLLSYSPEDSEIKTYSKLQGLSDTDIRFMNYHYDTRALVLVYANSNIDIFLGENNVYNLSFIKNYPYAQDKTVYNLEIIGNFAYISTAFGIVVVDVKKKEIKETYRLGTTVRSICKKGEYLYAATADGVKRGMISKNLLDPKDWEMFDEGQKNIYQFLLFKDYLFFTQWNRVYYYGANGSVQSLGLSNVRNIKLLNNQLVVLSNTNTYFYSDLTNYTDIQLSANSIDCNNSNNQYWLASGEAGLTKISKSTDSQEYSVLESDIKINSPKRNLNLYMTFAANKLFVTGGGKGENRFNTPGTLMVYENGKWFNFDENAISEKTGLGCEDFTSVAVDPADPMHYFVGSWGEGLYEFKNNEFVNLYSTHNSSLQSAVTGNNSNRFVRVDGLAFDNNNNLYMVNGGPKGLSIYMDQKEWKNFDYSPLVNSDPDQILISRDNKKWFNFFRGPRAGIMVLDEKGIVGGSSADYAYSGIFEDQQRVAIKATAYLAMAEDHNGLIWAGTDNGLIYFRSMDQVNNGVCDRIISTDQYDGGYRPLEGIKITSIAVDGGNRKWLGSAGSGIFILDQLKGNEIRVDNFTSENSFLLSNNINSLAIDHETGEVFIGTDKGLCSYISEAIAPKDDYSEVYAYPNPVRPENNNQVVITGLMQNSTVKITDLAGNLITEGVSMGGQYTWNCTNRFGTTVKAGIYLVFAANPDGSQGVATKIMVIK